MRIRLLAALFGISLAGLASAQAPAAPAKAPAATPATTTAPPAAPVPPPAAPPAVETSANVVAAEQAKPGDAKAGEAKSAPCGACHGMDGNSSDPQYPKIAGQHERYIARQLDLFKTGERDNPVMRALVVTLGTQDMRDLGAYFATKSALPGVADDGRIKPEEPLTWAQRGERIYRGGNAESGLPACMACHGPTGRGNPGPPYPELGGQHAKYTQDLLKRFRAGTVFGKAERASPIMSQVAASLSDEDITALASYLEGLHRSGGAAESKAAAPAAAAGK